MQKIYLTPGPSQLYFTVEEHMKTAFREQIPSISHRSQKFKDIYQQTDEGLRNLLDIPDNYRIVFTSSASEIWERTLQNCVLSCSYHLVNGAFSNKFYQTAQLLDFDADKIEVQQGMCVTPDKIDIKEQTELIAFTHNETSTGASQPLEDIYAVRDQHPDKLIAVDVVSSAPYVDLDYSKVDSVYFSVQKCFGLPAGLGVWLVNDRCFEASLKKESLRKSTGAFRLSNAYKMAANFQTVSTPNVLAIYLLSKVVADMNMKGIDQIRRETEYKAALLYHTLSQSKLISPFVKEEKIRSKTVVVAEVNTKDNTAILNSVKQKGMILGKGYGKYSKEHLRIANFPTHSKEQIELLSDLLLKQV